MSQEQTSLLTKSFLKLDDRAAGNNLTALHISGPLIEGVRPEGSVLPEKWNYRKSKFLGVLVGARN